MASASALARAVALGALLVAVATVLVPGPFRMGASMLVERTGLPEVLREVDGRLRAVEELPDQVWERLRGPFRDEEIEAEPAEALPAREPAVADPGRLESAIAGGLVRGVELGLRTVTFAIALSVAVSSLALWLMASAAGRLAEARQRTRSLEARVAALEAAGSEAAGSEAAGSEATTGG